MVNGLPQRGVIFSAALILAAFSFALPASAQAVLQAGPVLNGGGHAPMYLYSSPQGLATVMDSGAAGGGPIGNGLSEKLLQSRTPPGGGTGPFGAHDCDWSTYATNSAGANYLCFDPNIGGNVAALVAGGVGGAPASSFEVIINGTAYPIPGTISGLATVPTEAALALTSSTFASYILRADYAAGNGAPPLVYVSSASPCSLGSGSGDGGTQVRSNDGKCWLALPPSGGMDVREWGAVGNGSTDNTAIFASAKAGADLLGLAMVIPPENFVLTGGFNFGKTPVYGSSPLIPTNPPRGPTITCPVALNGPCVTIGITAGLVGGGIQDVQVAFAGNVTTGCSSTVCTGDQAILIEGFDGKCQNILAANAYDGITFANGGIAAHCAFVFTWKIAHDHIVNNNYPEVYLTSARLGMNNAGDSGYQANAFWGLTGSNPNGNICTDCQLNEGGVSPTYTIDAVGVGSSPDGIIFQMSDSVEDNGGLQAIWFHTDGSSGFFRINLTNNTINDTAAEMFGPNIPSMSQVHISNSNLFFNHITFPSLQYDGVTLSDVYIAGTLTLNGTTGSVASLSNVETGGNLTIEGNYALLGLSNLSSKSVYSDVAATGTIFATGTNPVGWIPVIKVNGTQVTLSDGGSNAVRQPDGEVKFRVAVDILNLNGASGSGIVVSGLPYGCAASAVGQTGVVGNMYYSGVTGITPPIQIFSIQNTATAQIVMQGPEGFAAVPAADMVPSTFFSGEFTCKPN